MVTKKGTNMEDVELRKSSPIPTKKKQLAEPKGQLDFFAALKELSTGKHITKVEWDDKQTYGFLDTEIVKLHKSDGKNYNWIISDGDLTGTDWIVLN